MKFPCPHCKNPTISIGKKYLAGKWLDVYCDECGGRSCSQPIILAVFYFLYVWDVMLFGYVAILKQSWFYLMVLIVGWIILDLFNFSVPLVAMKKKEMKPEPAISKKAPEKITTKT
jgi:hypothetical protein